MPDIPNLDPVQERASKLNLASHMTRTATIANDALIMMGAAQVWDELGETKTAEKCRGLAYLWGLVEGDINQPFIVPGND